jgi:folate-binding protein YgfZ
VENGDVSEADRAARQGLAHRLREAAILDVTGPDRESFLQGQLTQDVCGLSPGEARPAAALTPKGKLLFAGRLVGLPEAIRLLLPAASRLPALEHLRKFAAFQKVTVADRSGEIRRIGLYGPRAAGHPPPAEVLRLSGDSEFAGELLVPVARLTETLAALEDAGSVEIDASAAEVLRIEAGRPRFGMDIDGSLLPDEAGLEAAVSASKGCYVGQEIVARRRTYGRRNRRLVGFRFPEGAVRPGSRLRRPGTPPEDPGRVEEGRVTSAGDSPRFGPIGLGFAFHQVGEGDRLIAVEAPGGPAVVAALPFA